MNPDALLRFLVDRGGSDLFMHADGQSSIRLDGQILFVPGAQVSQPEAQAFFERLFEPHQQEQFVKAGEAGAAYDLAGIGRFRVSVYSQRGQLAFACRHVHLEPPDVARLGLPTQQVLRLARLRRGLVLVTGTAGSGKSTTLAGILQWLNLNEPRHVVTLEDPVEFLFRDARCTIHQRELGVDTISYAAALRHVQRQSPDVVLVGEMRDRETVEAALAAAETGLLVLSTLPTVDAAQTLERILWFFPQEQHGRVRFQLSTLVEGVLSQRLVPRADGQGRIPAVELLLATPTIREKLADGRFREIPDAIAENAEFFGTQTFQQSLAKLVRSNQVHVEDALAASGDPEGLQMEIRGVTKGGRARGADGAAAAGPAPHAPEPPPMTTSIPAAAPAPAAPPPNPAASIIGTAGVRRSQLPPGTVWQPPKR